MSVVSIMNGSGPILGPLNCLLPAELFTSLKSPLLTPNE